MSRKKRRLNQISKAPQHTCQLVWPILPFPILFLYQIRPGSNHISFLFPNSFPKSCRREVSTIGVAPHNARAISFVQLAHEVDR